MAQTSFGWKGTVNEVNWAQLGGLMGHGFSVAALGDCAVTQVTGSRAVSVAPGSIFGHGVHTTLSSAEQITLPAPTNGQWFLLVLNRVWSTKASSLQLRNGPTTATATSGLVPASYPASLTTGVGSNADVPVAWLWGNSTGTAVTIVPLLRVPSSIQPRSGSEATRNALYGAPTSVAGQIQLQGAQWYNTDQGWAEIYSGPYDATASPTGTARTAGWYPAPNSIFGSVGRSTATVQLGNTFAHVSASASWWVDLERVGITPMDNGWLIPATGRWLVEAALGFGTYASYIGVTVDSQTYSVDNFAAQAGGPLVAANSHPQFAKTLRLVKGQRLRLAGLLGTAGADIGPISTVLERSWFNVRYLGPSRSVG